MSRSGATLIGFSAVLMWGLLAFLSKLAGEVPALQLTAMSFFVGGCVGMATWPFRPGASRVLFLQKWQVWALNVGCLFGCHLLYFIAVRNAPVVEVSLIAYTWPLLIVVFSALAPGERLGAHHLFGVALGVVGAVFVISKGQGLHFSKGLQLGHLIAIPYAFLWAWFSVSIKKYGNIPTDIVVGFCFACAILSGLTHVVLEPTLWPLSSAQWTAILGLGLLPMGTAFYAWDFGMKHGDRLVLGAASYAAPLLSTLVLLASGFAVFHWSIAVGCLLITFGAIVAARDIIFPKPI